MANFGITLAYGRPELLPEMPIKVVHNLGDGGYTTQLEFETKVDVLPD